MNNLPANLPALKAGWSCVKLGDVVDNFKRGPFGSTIKKSFFVEKGYKVYEQKNAIYSNHELGNYFINKLKFLELQDFIVKPGDFIVSCSGTIGKIYRIPIKAPVGIINQALLRIRLKVEKITPNYFTELFKSSWFQKEILVETRGSAMLNITGVKELKQIYIPLPPLPIQKQIVEKIEELFSELDNGIENLRKAKEQIKTYKQSVLAYAFSGKLTGNVKGETENGKLPQGWKWVKLGEEFEIVTGNTPSKKEKKYYGKGFPFYKPTDLNVGINVFEASDNLTEKGINEARLLPAGSVLVTCIGATIGKTGLIKSAGASNQQINSIIYDENNHPKFVYYYCISESFQKQIKENASSTTLPILNKSKFEKLDYIKVPLEQQRNIVSEIERRFSVADKLEQTINESLEKSEQLKQSILKRAFEGKLV